MTGPRRRTLALVVQEGRRDRGWDVATAARAADVDPDVVRGVEAGEPVATDLAAALCGALGVDPVAVAAGLRPVDADHARWSASIMAAAAQGTAVAVPDVVAFDVEVGLDGVGPDLTLRAAKRRMHRRAASGIGFVCLSIAWFLAGVHLDARGALPAYDEGLVLIGEVLFGVVGLGRILTSDRGMDRVTGGLLVRDAMRRSGWAVAADGVTVYEVDAEDVLVAREIRASNVTAVEVEPEGDAHASVTVRSTTGDAALRWLPLGPAVDALRAMGAEVAARGARTSGTTYVVGVVPPRARLLVGPQ